MILLVNDASILIDLLKADLIEPFFQLEFELHVSDLVANEIQEKNATLLDAFVSNGKLMKKTFDFEELMEIQLLEVQYNGLSVPDCSCLYLSEKLSATLLTGDAALRKIAEQNNIPVHGLLWILDELVKNNLISRKTAFERLTYIISINPRLPNVECKKRLNKWKKGK
jgi:predicted nucleic acid-binding protein